MPAGGRLTSYTRNGGAELALIEDPVAGQRI